jgi:MYXO-CTERM domain-containing protein
MHTRSVPAALLAAALLAAPVRATDVGEIALVEDADGQIQAVVSLPNVYLARAACAFYADHPDRYDSLFVFTSIDLNFMTNTQQGWPVKLDIQGIGRDYTTDQTAAFCSADGRLRQAVKMGDIDILPADPDDRYTGIPFYPLSGIELTAHEFGHHWLASITFAHADGVPHCALRGFEPSGEPQPGACDGYEPTAFNQHWSYYFDSRSLMYGSMIEDLGGGSFRVTTQGPRYSPLDQYLMGLRRADEVPPMFLVDTGDLTGSASIPIQPGQSDDIHGTRVDFTIDDVIRAMGPRVPESDPCHWKAAFLIVHAAGAPPSDQQVAVVDAYRQRWEEFYAYATDGRGSFDTSLDGTGEGTAGCPAGAIQDGGTEDGTGEDGSTEDGSGQDGLTEDGATGDGSSEDGSAEDGSTQDASVDDGSGEDGSPDVGDPDGPDPGEPEGGGGCGCGVDAGGGPTALGLLALGLLFLARRRTARPRLEGRGKMR